MPVTIVSSRQHHAKGLSYYWLFAAFAMVLWSCSFLSSSSLLAFAAEEANSTADEEGVSTNSSDCSSSSESEEGHESEPAVAVLFPWFSVAIGIFVYLVFTRFAPWVPYTLVMFLLGTIMSVSALRLDDTNYLQESMENYWIKINGELLLVAFLPGLIYKDAESMNIHLLGQSFWQCWTFAFPMVLAGTSLTAVIAFYLLPFGWSFNLAMVFGAILSATDPVAVSALLEEVGAPPRLKSHITGEALMNDGSAIVFYTIFVDRFLYELNITGLGNDIGWAEGVALFFQMSLGGAMVGLFFGIGQQCISYFLYRRLSREENIYEVASTVAMAYLCYFTSEIVWGCSGVIATFALGLYVKAHVYNSFNDSELFEDFWSLVEKLLNTVLFTLGGLAWGRTISNHDESVQFTAKDWGFLILMYVIIVGIRFFLFAAFYPITVNIGLKTNWRETVFQCWGGLRGAVGIALALSLENTVYAAYGNTVNEFSEQVRKLFAIVGGIAFLTLLINATTAGPILKKLGLADLPQVREHVLSAIKDHWRLEMIDDMVRLLAQPRFRRVSFAIVREHVHILSDLTSEELCEATAQYCHTHGKEKPPYLKNILPYLSPEESQVGELNQPSLPEEVHRAVQSTTSTFTRASVAKDQLLRPNHQTPTELELRRIFLEILRSSYAQQLRSGEVANREQLMHYLLQSLDLAADEVNKGSPLCDFKYSELRKNPGAVVLDKAKDTKCMEQALRCWRASDIYDRYDVERALSFLEGHHNARSVIREEFCQNDLDVSKAGTQILQESREECKKAFALLDSYPADFVESVVSHRFCIILLNNYVIRLEHTVEAGLVKETEAETVLCEIQDALTKTDKCALRTHTDQVPLAGESAHGKFGTMWMDMHSKTERSLSEIAEGNGDEENATEAEAGETPQQPASMDMEAVIAAGRLRRRHSIASLNL